MTMELGNKYDYIDSLRELLLALHAYFGIHTWLILWPLWLWLVKKKKIEFVLYSPVDEFEHTTLSLGVE